MREKQAINDMERKMPTKGAQMAEMEKEAEETAKEAQLKCMEQLEAKKEAHQREAEALTLQLYILDEQKV